MDPEASPPCPSFWLALSPHTFCSGVPLTGPQTHSTRLPQGLLCSPPETLLFPPKTQMASSLIPKDSHRMSTLPRGLPCHRSALSERPATLSPCAPNPLPAAPACPVSSLASVYCWSPPQSWGRCLFPTFTELAHGKHSTDTC